MGLFCEENTSETTICLEKGKLSFIANISFTVAEIQDMHKENERCVCVCLYAHLCDCFSVCVCVCEI